jgi:hypothetical protein
MLKTFLEVGECINGVTGFVLYVYFILVVSISLFGYEAESLEPTYQQQKCNVVTHLIMNEIYWLSWYITEYSAMECHNGLVVPGLYERWVFQQN